MMAESRKPGSYNPPFGICRIPARTRGPLGYNDQGDPNLTTLLGDTPGTLGVNDYADPTLPWMFSLTMAGSTVPYSAAIKASIKSTLNSGASPAGGWRVIIGTGTPVRAADGVPVSVGAVQNSQEKVVGSGVTEKSVETDDNTSFIQEAVVPAQKSEVQTGVPASITIAQAILESAWGKNHMNEANNYFGVKAQTEGGKVVYGTIASGYVDKSTREYIPEKNIYITITAHFRSYKSMTDSILDHGLFLKNNPRYGTALALYAKSKNADEFARGLQKAGYATDPHYADSLIKIMKGRNLYQYNQK